MISVPRVQMPSGYKIERPAASQLSEDIVIDDMGTLSTKCTKLRTDSTPMSISLETAAPAQQWGRTLNISCSAASLARYTVDTYYL